MISSSYNDFSSYNEFSLFYTEHYDDYILKTKHTNFVFSSVGNNTNFDTLWVGENMNYDIYVIYYGNDDTVFNKYKDKVTFIEKRKGSKFQNFKYFYDTYPEIIKQYDRFFILDDDIIINVAGINTMFDLSHKYNLEICGPSFLPESKISHKITVHQPGIILRYTNFVEVNVPLFSTKALHSLMNKLSSNLIGWGIDYLYIITNGLDNKNSYAIVDSVTCINPHDNKKNNKRELSLIENCDKRQFLWEEFAKKNNYPVKFKSIQHSSISENEHFSNYITFS